MGKSIDLKSVQGKELLAKVTGQSSKSAPAAPVPPVAPAAKPAKLDRPLPAGVIIPNAETLLPSEKKVLEEINWKEGQPVPANLAEILEQVKNERANPPPPTDPRRPPLQVDVRDESTLTDAERADVHRKMGEMLQQAEKNAQIDTEMANLPASVRTALKAAQQPAPDRVSVVDDREQAAPEAPKQEAPKTEAGQEPAPDAVTATGANADDECQHCGWRRSEIDIPEPPYSDKLAFLQAILGEKTFTKDYPIFGGQVVVTFRSLTVNELDVIFRQVFRERELGTIPTSLDFAERISRYRLYLQLVAIKSSNFVHEFPSGFTRETNPNADSFYELPEEPVEGETGLRVIEKMMLEKYLQTESLNRSITNMQRQFNRLLSKMEAMADNSDFWKETGEQS